ncbi:hypothetical protein C8R44DRAFT_800333 [Mycena epipterygia]|nr:hypothetical protein C8R44DRAFT_800333 [Mycena epipterygia]
MLKIGTLEAPKGKKINEEAEMKTLLQEIGNGMRTESALVHVILLQERTVILSPFKVATRVISPRVIFDEH